MLKIFFIIFAFLLNPVSLFADEVECSSSLYSLADALPKVRLPEFGFNTHFSSTPDFCFDPRAGADFIAEFSKLKNADLFDENNCSRSTLTSDERAKVLDFVVRVMAKNELNIYAFVPEKKSAVKSLNEVEEIDLYGARKIVFGNNNIVPATGFRGSERLSTSDVLVIGGTSAAAVYLGTVMSKQLYKGEGFADKRKHEMAGALINFAGTGVGYLAVETLGLGDKLRMSKHARKCAVTASGALLLFAAAAGKEAYDKTKPKKHTVDVNDFVATVLGGGGGASFVVSCGFNF